MSKAGIEPNINSTRAIYLHLSGCGGLNAEYKAWKMLEAMHEGGHPIPAGAMNVVLESMVAKEEHYKAIELYKKSYRLCKANTETFNVLLRRLSWREEAGGQSKQAAMFLASEMQALGLKPDQLTYDRLILICAQHDDYEDAILYWDEMKAVGKQRTGEEWLLRPGTLALLARRCVGAGDQRAWSILKQLGERQPDQAPRMMKWAEKWWNMVPDSLSNAEWPKLTGSLSY